MDVGRFFDLTSFAYDLLTNQPIWHDQVATVVHHVPDGARVARVLDIGCGPGSSAFVLARLFPDAEVIGVDLSPKMISRARCHHRQHFADLENLRFDVGDATALGFDDGAFDLCVGHSFLYLVPDRPGVLTELRRVTAAGGRVALLEPNVRGSYLSARRRRFDHESYAGGVLDRARFEASMIAWRVVSGRVGRLDPGEVVGWFLDAGFHDATCTDTLGGLGMHCVGVVHVPNARTRSDSDVSATSATSAE